MREIDNTMWINCTYHNEQITRLERENKQFRKIVLEMEMEAIDLEKENNKLKDIYTNLADTVYTIEEELFIEAANLEYP